MVDKHRLYHVDGPGPEDREEMKALVEAVNECVNKHDARHHTNETHGCASFRKELIAAAFVCLRLKPSEWEAIADIAERITEFREQFKSDR